MDALFSVANEHATVQQYQDVLLRLCEVEEIMRRGTAIRRPTRAIGCAQNGPIAGLRRHSGVSLGSCLRASVVRLRGSRTAGRRPRPAPLATVGTETTARSRWTPRGKLRFAITGSGPGVRLDVRPEVVMQGRRGRDDAVALVERRLMEASQREGRHLPLKAAPRASASIADLTALTGRQRRSRPYVDPGARPHGPGSQSMVRAVHPDRAGPRIGLAGRRLAGDSTVYPSRGLSGHAPGSSSTLEPTPRLSAVLQPATPRLPSVSPSRRLRAAGVCCTVRTSAASVDTARLWAAALAFPITQRTAGRLLQRLDPNKE